MTDVDDKIKDRRIRRWEREREPPEEDACSLCGATGKPLVTRGGYPECRDEVGCWRRRNNR